VDFYNSYVLQIGHFLAKNEGVKKEGRKKEKVKTRDVVYLKGAGEKLTR
jgi:hypothetical protein